MEKINTNNVDIEINSKAINNFLQQLVYPLAIFDFETFRNLVTKKKHYSYINDFEKIFSLAILVITSKEELSAQKLQNKKLRLFVKTVIPEVTILKNEEQLFKHQQQFFHFLITKLIKYQVKSLVLLGARTEILLLKNYLAYHEGENKFKSKISYFFHHHKIFDLYDMWNKDTMINLPLYKKAVHQDVGATKKTTILIKNNNLYSSILKPQLLLTNNDIGRIIDAYFFNNICLLPNFKTQIATHNQNDVLIGAAILSFLYQLTSK